MNPVLNSSQSILWSLRCLDWIFIAVIFLTSVTDGSFSVSQEYSLKTLAFLGAFAALSWLFPLNRPWWLRQGYILLGILLVVSAKLLAIDLDFLLYLYILKSCFLLNRPSVLFTVVVTGIAFVFSKIWNIPQKIELEQSINLDPYDPRSIAISSLGFYLASSTFVILFGFVVIAEQRSRQRAEALARQVETLATSLERTRIARDMHDSLGHTLTNLDIQLEVAQKFHQCEPDKALQALSSAKLLASQCIDDVSRALQTMRQSDFDLNQALSTLVEQFGQNQSLRVKWEVNLPSLSLYTSHQIYCIVKEGLINIQKHACASCVRFQGQSTPEGIILDLEDDGVGFNPEMPKSGLGLKGMAERVHLLGGKLEINTAPGQGTQIQVTLPL